MLSEQQIERYSRQIILPQLGGRGQERLLSAKVAIVGRGELATAAALYVAAAGIGTLAIGAPELQSVLDGLNPDCHVSVLPAPLTSERALETAGRYEAVLASGAAPGVCTALNAACVARRTPLVWGDTAGPLGLVTVLAGDHPESHCYACVQSQVPRLLAGGDAAHALAEAAAAFIGTLQATEAIKLLIGLDTNSAGRLLAYNAAAGTVGEVTVARDPRCRVCGASCA